MNDENNKNIKIYLLGYNKMYFVYNEKIYQGKPREIKGNTYTFYKPNGSWYQDYIVINQLFVWETVDELKQKLHDRVRHLVYKNNNKNDWEQQ